MIDGKSILDQLLGAAPGQAGGQGRGGLGDLSRMSGSLGSGGQPSAPPSGGAGGGSLGDLLGGMLGGNGGAGGAAGGAGGAGGLGDLIGGMLGGAGAPSSGAAAGGRPGGGIGDIVGKVTEYAKQNPGLSMAGAGGLAAVLFGGKGPKLKADALTLGGLAAIGTLAYKAFQQYKINNPSAPAPAGTQASLPPADSPFHPANAPGGPDVVALSIVSAMIAAAKADGTVDATERQKILGKLGEGGLSAEERDFLNQELAGPLDINKVVNSATGPEHAIQLYAASLLAIDPDHPAERAYLDMLAARLGLEAGLKTSIEQAVAGAAA